MLDPEAEKKTRDYIAMWEGGIDDALGMVLPVDKAAGSGPVAPPVHTASLSKRAGPLPGGDTPDWKAMADRLGWGQIGRSLSKSYENSFANVAPDYRPNAHAGDVLVESAQLPIDMAKERQGYESRDLAMQGQRASMAAKSAMSDPNSLQSQKARESLRAAFPDMKFPAGFDNYSADDVGALIKMTPKPKAPTGGLTEYQRLQMQRQGDIDAGKARAAQEKAAAEEGALKNSRAAFAKELEALGIDPEHASQKDIDRAIELKKYQGSHEIAQSNNAIAQAGRRDKDEDRATLRESIPFADGELRFTGSGTPREDDKREAQKVSKASNGAIAGMNDLEVAMGAFARNPSAATRDEVVAKTRVVSGALNTAAEQGAMSKDEADEMAKALGVSLTAPGSLAAAWEKIFGNDAEAAASMTRRVKSVRDSVKKVAIGKAKVFGFDFAPRGGQDASGGKVTPNGKPYAKKQQNKKTGAVRYLDAAGNVIEETNG